MGLFKKKKNNSDLSPAEQDFQTVPINGGNSFEIQQALKAQDLINKNTIPRLNIGKYSKSVEDKCYNLYWLLQFQANYFVSIFPVKTKDARLNQLIYQCFRVHFLYGNCGIYKLNDDYIGLYEKKVHYDKLGMIEKIEFALINELLAGNSIDIEHVKVCFTLTKEQLQNYARLRTTSIGFGAIVTWLPFIKQQESILKKVFNYSFIFHRKISYKAADLSTSATELDNFFNEDIPFYIELDADIGTGNRFSSEGISSGSSGGTKELIDYYNFFIECYYHLLGRRFNVDEKRERNISSEVEASQENFDILHAEDRIVKEEFLNRLKEISGVEWEELRKEQKDESKPNSNKHGMNGASRDKE